MKICCLGDSLTEGDYGVFGKRGIANIKEKNYPYFLQELSNCQVFNYGKCGYKASDYLSYYMSGAVKVQNADIIIIMLGTNGGLDLENDTAENKAYDDLIDRCICDAPKAVIYLCTPPHVTKNPEMSNFGHEKQVAKAVEFTEYLACKKNLALIDLANCEAFTAENEHIMQPNDGLHFSETGYHTMAEYIYSKIKLI